MVLVLALVVMLLVFSLLEAQKSHGRAHVLHETLKGFVQRKDIRALAAFLPPSVVKEEIVIIVKLSAKQRALTKDLWIKAKCVCVP